MGRGIKRDCLARDAQRLALGHDRLYAAKAHAANPARPRVKPKRKDSVRRWTSSTGERERKTPEDAPASLAPATGRAVAQRRQSQGDGTKAIGIKAGRKAPCADCRDKPSGEGVLHLAWAWL